MADTRPILIHTYAGPFGGSERILLDLLERSQLNLVLACTSGVLADAAEALDIPVLRLKSRPLATRGVLKTALAIGHFFGYGRNVRALIKDIDPILSISWNMRSAIAMSLSGGHLSHPTAAEHVDLLPEGLRGRLARRSLLSHDRVVALSGAIARDLKAGWATDGRIAVVYPGVELPVAGPVRAERKVALVLAAIEPWKRQDLALEAVAKLPGIDLVIAGEPVGEGGENYLATLTERAGRPDLQGRVHFVGQIDSQTALTEASVLVHACDREPLGRVIVEAMAAGRPVVAADACGPAEILDHQCGRLVSPSDTQAFTDAIAEITADTELAAELGRSGRRRAAEQFDPARQAKSWDQSISSIAGPVGHASLPSEPAGSNVSLVTVIHESAAELSRLLASVKRHLPAAEIIVVDSGSTDGGAALAAVWPGNVKVIQLDGNLGFGSGCVAGLNEATRPVTCLINPDVELVDSSLDDLSTVVQRKESKPVILAPLLIHPDGERQDSVHPIPGSWPELLRAFFPASILPRRAAAVAEPHRRETPVKVGWAVGACLVAQTETFTEFGPFDPSVHLYAEDLDLGLRAGLAGVETWFHPEARVIHREAHSSKAVFGGEPYELLARRRRTVIGERLGRAALLRDDLIQLLTNFDRAALKVIARKDSSAERSRILALKEARREK